MEKNSFAALGAYLSGVPYNVHIHLAYVLPLTKILDLAKITQPRGMTLSFFLMASAINRNVFITTGAYQSGAAFNAPMIWFLFASHT
jgi:hypothetical protein